MEKSNQYCLVCKSKTKLYSRIKNFQIYKCLNCGFGATINLKIESSNYHRDESYKKEEGLFRNIFLKRVNLISKYIKPGSALEVGSSTGLMLSLLKMRGWQVLGVEISKNAAEESLRRGVKVIVDDFEKIKLNQKFELIVFNHSLEHLINPIKDIEKAKSLLKPKGILYIDLPNFDSFSAKILKGRWPLLLPDEHLWHFTIDSLELLLKKMGFKILISSKASGIWDVANPAEELFLSLSTFKKRFFVNLVTLIPSLIFTKLGIGSGLTVVSRKR